MKEKWLLLLLVIGVVFLAGCVQQPQEEKQATGVVNETTGEYEETGVTIVKGSFNLTVVECLGDALVIRNDGTGTALLNESTLVQSRGGILTYGTVKGNYVLQPGDVKVVQLTRDLNKSGLYRFRLNTVMKSEEGNNYVITYFECSE